MKSIKNLTVFGCNSRLASLLVFRELVFEYFNNITVEERYGAKQSENEKAQRARHELNEIIPQIAIIFAEAEMDPSIIWSAPPAVGGRSHHLNLVDNIFLITSYGISPQHLVDYLERAIGKYESVRVFAFFRTFNPFFWLGRLLVRIAEVPFWLFEEAGFNRSALEVSAIGRWFKVAIMCGVSVCTFLFGLITFLESLGYLHKFKQFVHLP